MFILRKNACAPQRMSDSHSSDSESETKAPPVKAPRVTAPQDEATATLHVEDCVKTLRRLPAGECALVLADPPYEGVVSAQWDAVHDYMGFSRGWIGEAVRVLRPGGALLVYGSPERNWIPRLAVMLEDEFGDRIQLVQHLSWVFNQGFPNHSNLS